MFRRLMVVTLTIIIILAVGWLTLRRGDIPYERLDTIYANADSRFLKLENDTRMHFRDVGPRDAPVIVLVHGYSSSLHTWESWVDTLKSDYRVISLDLPGHGLTGCPDIETIGIEQFVGMVDRLVASLRVDRFTLVGSSMGGNTAWEYALAHPDKLDALVLVGASGWPEVSDGNQNEPMIFKLLRNDVARAVMKDLDMSSLVRSGLEDSFVDTAFVTDAMVERYTALSRAPCHRDALLTLAAEVQRALATEDRLSSLTTPTLILHGAEDNLVPVSGASKFEAAIEGAKLIIYDDVGHLPQEEIAARSVGDFQAFLDRILVDEAPLDSLEPPE